MSNDKSHPPEAEPLDTAAPAEPPATALPVVADEPERRGRGKAIGMAGAAVGSAAIVAALLFYNRAGKDEGKPRRFWRKSRRGEPGPANED